MSLIIWTDEFSVGVVEIDNQHKGLVKLINKLYDAMTYGQANKVLREIIQELVKYTQIHFATEEKYFVKFDYEDSEAHIEEHHEFIASVQKFKEGFEAGNIVLSVDIFKFLKGWLTNHILGSDKKFMKCFNENGLF
jgi:hemerythrin-like metal-binding protein